MKRKKSKNPVLQSCENILAVFDGLENRFSHGYAEERGTNDLLDYWQEVAKYQKTLLPDDANDEQFDNIMGILFDLTSLAFGFGYVVGQKMDLPYPSVQGDIDKIMGTIREKHLLPYLPRERRTTP